MEHKTWLWRKKSSEKTIIISEKSDLSLVENEQEKDNTLGLERSLKDLKEQLSFAHTESNAKDDLLAKQTKVAEEAIAGWEKAEAEAVSFKQDRDDALLQKAAAEERIINIDASLKECMQQVHVLKEENLQTMGDAAMKISREQGKIRILEDRLAELNKRLAKLGADNSNLSRIIEGKGKLIEELNESKSNSEANFTAIVARLDSSEKINASLKYEVCMLQKELEIRNEEREFNLKSADAAHKQHLESIKKISKLETECQRLRIMVRKRLPGPAALAKMRTEVEMLGNNATETRQKKSNPMMEALQGRDFVPEYCYDVSSKSVASLLQRLHAIEDENKILKETLTKKNSEIQSLRAMFACTAYKLSQAEKQLNESSKGQACLELARSSPIPYDLSLGSISEDGCNEDSISCTESWASALISELEHFKPGKLMASTGRTATASDLSLMDDFVEMEKLALVCLDKPHGDSCMTSKESNAYVPPKEIESKPDPSEATGMELVPVDCLSDASEANHRLQSSYIAFEKHPSWIQDILKVIFQKHKSTQRSLDDILEEVRLALSRYHALNGNPSNDLYTSGNTCQKSQRASWDSFDGALLPSEISNQLFQSDFKKTVHILIELLEGIICRLITNNNAQQILSENDAGTDPYNISSLTGYVARVFLWESSELSTVLQRFISVCNNLLDGKPDLQNFAGELTSTLEWIINHCFSLKDVLNMKEMIKKHFDVNESNSDNEFDARISKPGTETQKIDLLEGFKFKRIMPSLTSSNGLYILSQIEDIESKLKDENKRLKFEIINMENRKKDLEERLESANVKSETLTTQLIESKENIANLQGEIAALKESKGLIENQTENYMLINEDLGTQLTVAKVELNEAHQKASALEVELEEKSNCCDELEAMCLELQIQLESVAAKETPRYDMGQKEKQLRTNWEISAASKKLAECQETILDLGKQLKALASSKDADTFDKEVSTPAAAVRIHRRTQLLDHMRAEDNAKSDDPKSPKTKEIICAEPQKPSAAALEKPNAGLLYGQKDLTNNGTNNSIKNIIQPSPTKSPDRFYGLDESSGHRGEINAGALVLVPKREVGGVGLLRKLLLRRKNESSKKLTLPVNN